MRRLITAALCAFAMLGGAGVTLGCAPPPPPAGPAPPGPPARHRVKAQPTATFELVEGALKLPGPVVFETGNDRLSPVSDEVLEVVLDYMSNKTEVTLLRIEGHTDSDGTPAANQTLSERRALAVARWLTAAGIDCHRLLPVGFGQDRPVVPNTTADNKAQNRRVAFVNAALLGRPLGNLPSDGGGKHAGDPCQ
jgi:OOP family OmpA-OmpF porin